MDAPRIVPQAGAKLKHLASNLPKVLTNAQQPYQCICARLQHMDKHLHPKMVEAKKHICTTDIAILGTTFPRLKHALTKPPNFRPNEPGSVIKATQSACNEWIASITSAEPNLQQFATTAATLAAKQSIEEYNCKWQQYQADLPDEWKEQLLLFSSQGGIVSHADKQPLLVITCQVLAVAMTLEMLSNTRRYVATDLSEDHALQIMQMVLDEAIGEGLKVGTKAPILIQHIKTHKQHKPSGMEYRPTTNTRNAGGHIHANILFQMLRE